MTSNSCPKCREHADGLHGQDKEAFEGGGHALELAGLGALAYPSVQEARGKKVSPKTKRTAELGGLGVLAAHPAYSLGKHLLGK